MSDNVTSQGRTVLRSHRPTNARHGEEKPADKRRAERKPACKQIIIRVWQDGVLLQPQQAMLCDASAWGMGVILNTPLKPGDKFHVHLDETRSELLYKVVRCRSCGDCLYRVGAELVFVKKNENGGDTIP